MAEEKNLPPQTNREKSFPGSAGPDESARKGHELPAEPALGSGGRAFVRSLGFFFVGLKYMIVIIFVFAFLQGIFIVKEHEEAMLFRFGRLVRRSPDQSPILTSGRLYWAWPYPIDEVKRIPARRPITLTTRHFWLQEDPNQMNPDISNMAADGQTGLPVGQGGYALTGDTNIIHMQWAVVYTVRDAAKYYLDFFDGEVERADSGGKNIVTDEKIAEKLILNCLESAALTEVASWSVEDVLYKARTGDVTGGGRELLTAAVQTRLETRLAELDLGVEVLQVMMTPRAPNATLQAFQEVNNAANEYRTALEQARGYEKQVTAEAEGQASKILADARAYKNRVVASVRADAAYFETVLKEYRKNPRTMLTALYADTVKQVLGQVKSRYIIHASDGDQEIRLMINPEPEPPAENDNQ